MPLMAPCGAAKVVEDRLEDVFGFYDIGTHTIYVDSRLSWQAKRSTVMHEQVHAERGDYAITSDPHADIKQERAVERETARRLVSFSALAEGMKWCRSVPELAEYLGVDAAAVLVRFEFLSTTERALLAQSEKFFAA